VSGDSAGAAPAVVGLRRRAGSEREGALLDAFARLYLERAQRGEREGLGDRTSSPS